MIVSYEYKFVGLYLWLYQIIVVAHDVSGKRISYSAVSSATNPTKSYSFILWQKFRIGNVMIRSLQKSQVPDRKVYITGTLNANLSICCLELQIIGSFRLFVASFLSGWVWRMLPRGVSQHRPPSGLRPPNHQSQQSKSPKTS